MPDTRWIAKERTNAQTEVYVLDAGYLVLTV